MSLQTIETAIGHYLNLFKAHERLFLFLAVGFFGVHFYTKGIDYLTKRDQTQADTAKHIADDAANKVKTDDQQTQLLIAQLAQLQQESAQQKAKLDADIAARAKSTTNQKTIDDKSTLPALATRIQSLVGVGQITAIPEGSGVAGSLRFDEAASHKVGDDEEDLAELRLDNRQLNSGLVEVQQVVGKQSEVITGLNTEVADGKTALQTEKNSHADDVKTLKSKNRTSWLHGFKWGFIAGATVGEVARIALLHKP